MKTLIRVVLPVVGLLLGACGPGAKLGGGKEGAAQALSQASSALTREGTTTGVNVGVGSGGANVGINVEVQGRRGGFAKVSVKTAVSTGGGSASAGVDTSVIYQDFSEDGRTRYNGSVETHQSVFASKALSAVEVSMTGKLTMTGEIEDFLDIQISESVSVDPTTVGLKLTGSISTSEETFTYDGEAMQFGIDLTLPAKPRS